MAQRHITRRTFLKGMGGAAVGAVFLEQLAGRALAAKACYPSRTTVRWIVPYSPGGGYNVYSRMLEPFAEEELGAEIVVENHPGAGGAIGMTKTFKSRANGRTLGILNAGGMVMAGVAGEVDFTVDQYTILGRLVDTRQVIFVGKPTYQRGIRTIEDVLKVKKPLIWGVTGPASNGFFGAAVLSHVLGIKRKFLSGYPGSAETILGATKGEVDIIEFTFSSVTGAVEAGDVIPIALVGPKVPNHPIFKEKKIPTVMEIAKMVGANPDDALGAAQVTAAGRVLAGPPGIPPGLAKCLGDGLYRAMTRPGFRSIAKGARRPIDPINADEARKAMKQASNAARKFKPVWKKAVKELGV
ncbi:MAG: Bug family tripartite tricarboxylate transporter substrate binding protein [Candidatus Binatia bacterium]